MQDSAPPAAAQQFTNEPPSGRGAQWAQLPSGAKEFAREYLPEDDNKDCLVSFEVVNEYKPFKSQIARDKAIAEGREPGPDCEVYEDVVYIRKSVRGNSTMEVHRPMWPSDKREFPFSWQEFERGNKLAERGTPLSKLGLDSRVIRDMNAKNIHTVEDLSMVTDTWLHELGTGARELRKRALDYVDGLRYNRAVKSSSDVAETKAQVNQQAAQMEQVMAMLQKLSDENEQLKAQLAEDKPRRGRPPKSDNDAA